MRIDKFLKTSRLIKRRTIAKEACLGGKVTINNMPAKAGSEVKVGDIVTIFFGNGDVSAKVLKVSESCRKEEAASMYEIISGSG